MVLWSVLLRNRLYQDEDFVCKVSASWLVTPVSLLVKAGSHESVHVETKLHLSKHRKVENKLLLVCSHKS